MESSCVEIISHGPDETRAIGRLLGAHAAPGDVFLLNGPLGAGKTCLAQGILWGLGSAEYARSPTFVLVAEYEARLTLYHIDLYRIGNVDEIGDLGLEEYLDGQGVCVVEWAEKLPTALTERHVTVQAEYIGERTRRLRLSATGRRYAAVLRAVQSNVSKR